MRNKSEFPQEELNECFSLANDLGFVSFSDEITEKIILRNEQDLEILSRIYNKSIISSIYALKILASSMFLPLGKTNSASARVSGLEIKQTYNNTATTVKEGNIKEIEESREAFLKLLNKNSKKKTTYLSKKVEEKQKAFEEKVTEKFNEEKVTEGVIEKCQFSSKEKNEEIAEQYFREGYEWIEKKNNEANFSTKIQKENLIKKNYLIKNKSKNFKTTLNLRAGQVIQIFEEMKNSILTSLVTTFPEIILTGLVYFFEFLTFFSIGILLSEQLFALLKYMNLSFKDSQIYLDTFIFGVLLLLFRRLHVSIFSSIEKLYLIKNAYQAIKKKNQKYKLDANQRIEKFLKKLEKKIDKQKKEKDFFNDLKKDLDKNL